MSDAFRDLLKLVGSGTHTSKSLSREQAMEAMLAMLKQTATPAQIGAFMIAHRIKRPTSEELAGMLDAYDHLGPHLTPANQSSPFANKPPLLFGIPYDGRSRTAPFGPSTALILLAAGIPCIQHGGDRMPTKYGVPLVALWQELGVDWSGLTLAQTQSIYDEAGVGLVYQPQHFPEAEGLVTYRDQIGKRPPSATLELVWAPYEGSCTVVAGYVHPPTEERLRRTCAIKGGYERLVMVKGLEGSCDLPRNRTAIACIDDFSSTEPERMLLHPRDYGMDATEVACPDTAGEWGQSMATVLAGTESEWSQAAIWNGGFYLWIAGVTTSLESGLKTARDILLSGKAQAQLEHLKTTVAGTKPVAAGSLS